jgi:HK97 gp10 family phage protein
MISASVKSTRKVDTTKAMARINAKFLESAAVILQGAARRNAPIDNGRLKGSISREVKRDVAIVGTNVEYAPHVEYGTRPHVITVKNARVLSDGKQIFGRSVNHPGTKAQPFMRPAVDKNRKNLIKLYRDIYRQVFSG